MALTQLSIWARMGTVCAMIRGVRAAALILTLALLSTHVRADGVTDAADQVLAAFEAQGKSKLEILAKRDDPDPWLVADELCFRGKHEVAMAFSQAAPRPDTKLLPAYVTSRRKRRSDPETRRALERTDAALRKGRAEDALAAVDAVTGDADDVVSLRRLRVRGIILRRLRRLEESTRVFLAAAERARRLGWLAEAASFLHEAGMSCHARSDFHGAFEAHGMRLQLEEVRQNPRGIADTLDELGFLHAQLGEPSRSLKRHQRALAIRLQIGNRFGIAYSRGCVGVAYHGLGEGEKALGYLEQTLATMTELGERQLQANTHMNIGNIHSSLGAQEKALASYTSAMAIFEALSHHPGVAGALDSIASVHVDRREYARALEAGKRALVILEEIGSPYEVAVILGNLGTYHTQVGEYADALACQERSLAITEKLGFPAGVAVTLVNIGGVHRRRGDYKKAMDCCHRAHAIFLETGDRAGCGAALRGIGNVHASLGEYTRALEAYGSALEIARQRGDRKAIAGILADIGCVHENRDEHRTALDRFRGALALWMELGHGADVVQTLLHIAHLHWRQGAWGEARRTYDRALSTAREIGDRLVEADALDAIADSFWRTGPWSKVRECYDRVLAIARDLENRQLEANALGNLASVHASLGCYDVALEHCARTLALMKALGDRGGMSSILVSLASVHKRRGAYGVALTHARQALSIAEELDDRPRSADALAVLAGVHLALGEYATARTHYERVLEIWVALEKQTSVARTLVGISLVHGRRAEYALELRCLERALVIMRSIGSRSGEAGVLANLGTVYQGLGDPLRALDHHRRALAIMEEMGDRMGIAVTLLNMGTVRGNLGEHAQALEIQERALEVQRELGHRGGEATALTSLGRTHLELGEPRKALECHERALDLARAIEDRLTEASANFNAGLAHHVLGEIEEALESYQRCHALAVSLGAPQWEVWSLAMLARVSLDRGDARRAAALARGGVNKLPAMLGKLSEEQGAAARGLSHRMISTGVRAGARLGDPEEVLFFLESGRAGTLLESLGGRDALREVTIEGDLEKEERKARIAVVEASAELSRSHRTGRVSATWKARAALEAAREDLLHVVERIQRSAKAAADVTYPEPASMAEVRGSLREGEALALYAVMEEQALALVVTPEGSRIVPLGEPAEIVAACERLVWTRRTGIRGLDLVEGGSEAPGDLTASVAALRALVIAPLGLDASVSRLLISPDGALCDLPFALVCSRELVYVPSGTTYGVLRAEAGKRGAGVLALGDPDYGSNVDERAMAVHRSGSRLRRLLESGREANAIGDEVLLGSKATENGFIKALRRHPRWRSVHFACHGLIDPERPMLSSLAITGSEKEDGFLTTLEVFRMRIPADLVVLSACETGRGKVYRAEGIVGFTRAFMFAGAPRVIVSLWKVDDKATCALMAKFYELWKPGKMATATALKKAQEYVRSHDKWKHPYYWAAWQLWGLPD